MAIQKRPYELSVWVEKLNGSNSKIEEKGVIIGAHDMSYPGRATNIVLKREIKGTNTLTFQMPDVYFDSLTGDYVRNEFIDVIYPETKLKLFYKNRWYEFFVKKVDEKKQLKSYMKTFTCSDAFIDELSRNGYGITYDTELNNNVEEIGVFTEETLEDSIWQYHPENNWGDFTEFKEEKLYRIPVSCFGGAVSGYKLSFELENEQRERIKNDKGTDVIHNMATGEERPVELNDDLARGSFWDEYNEEGMTRNALDKDYHTNIPNDGYIYVPYSCLNFCYGTPYVPEFGDVLKYDRAATETAIDINNKLILSPPSVDPRTIIQFYAIPSTAELELDEDGVILNKDYTYFMTLNQWNRAIQLAKDWWYIFEDTRLCQAEVLGSADVAQPSISHTFKYLMDGQGQVLGTDYEYRGNKCVFYDGYLSDVNNNTIVKGKKFSITNRTEVNISEEIDQYTTIYNCHADDFADEFSSEDWTYDNSSNRTSDGSQYRVCSKLETRQIIPQLARNLVQNGTDMDSVDGWSPMSYLIDNDIFITPSVSLRGVSKPDDPNISTSSIIFQPSVVNAAQIYKVSLKDGTMPSDNNPSQEQLDNTYFTFNRINYYWGHNPVISLCEMKKRIERELIANLKASESGYVNIYSIGMNFYYKDADNNFQFLFQKGDPIHQGMTRKLLKIENTNEYYNPPIINDEVHYSITSATWIYVFVNNENRIELSDISTKQVDGSLANINGREIVNFGIIGQEKTIEKDKIYCLGISSWATESFSIRIGKGALISQGEYTVADDYLEFSVGNGQDIDIDIYNEMPTNYETTQNLEITTVPKPKFIFFKAKKNIENPYIIVSSEKAIVLFKLYLFEAYTKGIDSFPNTNNTLIYRYSGRDLFWPPKNLTIVDKGEYEKTPTMTEAFAKNMVIFEDDIMLGSTYEYQHYYIQRLKATSNVADPIYCDTMGAKTFTSSDVKLIKENSLPLDAAKYTLDDCEIQTNYIDLNKCKYYDKTASLDQLDCTCGNGHTCFYQKFGYCPFRFKTEKHNRRIRTLSIDKSNRFNIIQETSKVFEVYPQFYIEHKSNGTVIRNDEGEYLKKVFYITEKGKENKVGFRYEKNLKDISRNIVSDQIVTKLYVLDVDSELSKTGICSIKTAEDNPSKDSYIIDLSYYIEKGMLDRDEVEQDLYGTTPSETSLKYNKDQIPSGFLKQLGYYNTQYDKLTNKIINLEDNSFIELQANMEVNYQGIITAQEQLLKIKKQIDKYKSMYTDPSQYEEQQVYLNYLTKLSEQQSILTQLIYGTFYTDGVCDSNAFDTTKGYAKAAPAADATAIEFFDCITDLEESKKYWIDQHSYTKGILGQYNSEYLQIQQWKRERASYLKLINQISSAFYKKYEPYLKEGTWSDDNYLTDNAYYFGALDVAADGAIPKVTYTITVINIAPLSEEYADIYDVDLADVTYVEDIGMFGINKHTGLPNRLRALCSAIEEGLDDPSKDKITVQNYTTSFQDIFQQVTASVQSLTYNENIYKRSSNFTSLQNITNSSLQGALDTNDLTLLNTEENNIQVDNTGTSGSDINNHANKYRLDGQGLFFSNDGGQHWSVGVGPSGINADYIKVGTLDAGKIRIADSAYVYFSWDKDGIVAYRDPQGINTDASNINDMAMFNKYGLSIVKNGKIKLRAGYNYSDEHNGDINKETEQDHDIGFYLYNNHGTPIFSTTEVGDGARLSLTGEIFVNNNATTSSGGATFSYSQKYISETYDNCYNIRMVDGSHYVENIYNDYLNLSVGDIIEIEGTNYQVSSRATQPALIKYANDNLLRATQYIYEFKDPEQPTGPVTKTLVFFYGNTVGSTKYYFEVSGDSYSTNFMKIVDTEMSSQSDVQLTGAYTFGEYSNTETATDPATGVLYYKKLANSAVNAYRVPAVQEGDPDTFWQEKRQTGGSTGSNGEIALFINTTEIDTAENDSRLFVTCKREGNEVRNIFSIQKGGNLYIGGKLLDRDGNTPTDVATLDDRINVQDPSIAIIKNGNGVTLQMDFENLKDKNGRDITQVVSGAVQEGTQGLAGAHYHTFGTEWVDRYVYKYENGQKTDEIIGVVTVYEPAGDTTNWYNP